MASQVESVPPQLQPKELSFPLPKALHTTAHVHLTVLETCVMVLVTASTPGETLGSTRPMGSFVYAMPDVSFPFPSPLLLFLYVSDFLERTNTRSVLSTSLYTAANIEFTTRLAKILARRMSQPVYVGCSLDPGILGLMVEEEMEGLSRIVDVMTGQWR